MTCNGTSRKKYRPNLAITNPSSLTALLASHQSIKQSRIGTLTPILLQTFAQILLLAPNSLIELIKRAIYFTLRDSDCSSFLSEIGN